MQASLHTMVDKILYYIGQKDSPPRVLLPSDHKQKLIKEYHAGIMSGHFSGPKIYKAMSQQWWWEHMYQDINSYTCNCPQCAIATGVGRKQLPPMNQYQWTTPSKLLA